MVTWIRSEMVLIAKNEWNDVSLKTHPKIAQGCWGSTQTTQLPPQGKLLTSHKSQRLLPLKQNEPIREKEEHYVKVMAANTEWAGMSKVSNTCMTLTPHPFIQYPTISNGPQNNRVFLKRKRKTLQNTFGDSILKTVFSK
ncbi:hypothetical protein TNCT_219021 [Trichonephila clavata]|uniref:Uncharacterized protein n=1 Tax=Trichonephila clavata TaxID=2740835 RepID=A0A8X6JG38_TRICU|nr:hypothetical protein TNCT_219021 [Trichonephila clavata]